MVLLARDSGARFFLALLMRNAVRQRYQVGLDAKYATALSYRGQWIQSGEHPFPRAGLPERAGD
jgi:hypothetical protein